MYKPKQPKLFQSDVNNQFLSRPNEGIQFGSNGQEYSGGATGSAGKTFNNPRDESSYWDNDATYKKMIAQMQSMPVGAARDALRIQIEDYRSNRFNIPKLPAGATNAPTSPIASVNPASTPAATPPVAPLPTHPSQATAPSSFSSQSSPTNIPSAAPAAAAAVGGAQTPTGSGGGGSDPCAGIMDQIKEADAMRNKLEATARPSHVGGQHQGQTREHDMQISVLHKIQIDNYKQLMACKELREKERNAPRIKAQKEKLALTVKNAAAVQAFHVNAKHVGQKQIDNVQEKATALLSISAIGPEQYQAMIEDPSTYSDTVDRLWSQNFNEDVGSANVGHNENPPLPPAPVEPPKAPYGQQNSGRYDRFKPEPAFTPPPQPPQPQQPNKPPYGYPNYSAYG